MARKWFGRRSATTKASATGPMPITAAMTTSRTNPVILETSVQPPTDRTCFSIRSRSRGGATLVADDLGRRSLNGIADPLGDDIERAALHLGEDAADILADDAKRHELHAAEEGDRDDERGIAGDVDAEEKGPDREIGGGDRQHRDEAAEIGPDP